MKRLLLVEGDPEEAEVMGEIVKRNQGAACIEVTTASSAEEAMVMLVNQLLGRTGRLPHVILLDLHLPGKDGFELLRFLKSHRRLKLIPVIVYSATENIDEISRCYELFANSFINKTYDRAALDSFSKYWFDTARLPQWS